MNDDIFQVIGITRAWTLIRSPRYMTRRQTNIFVRSAWVMSVICSVPGVRIYSKYYYCTHRSKLKCMNNINIAVASKQSGSFRLETLPVVGDWSDMIAYLTIGLTLVKICFDEVLSLTRCFQGIFFSVWQIHTCEGVVMTQCVDNVTFPKGYLHTYHFFTLVMSFLLPFFVTIISGAIIVNAITLMKNNQPSELVGVVSWF